MYKTKQPTDMEAIYKLRPFSAYIHKDYPLIYFLLYNDNFQYVVAPNEEPEKYLQDSDIDISELVQTSAFSKLQGDSIHWDLFM